MSAQQRKRSALPTGGGGQRKLHRNWEALHQVEMRNVFKTKGLVREKERGTSLQDRSRELQWRGAGTLWLDRAWFAPAIAAGLFLCEPEMSLTWAVAWLNLSQIRSPLA